ncbi:MAG TPA: protein-L-isoaspartate(D-aspartate) O-methyltransferase [Bacteroidales bacterium]|nr:protein-L-isoaspartate(D-aspartate) O-methyltransferase [Bacteroidales bacterium]HNS45936.1 protein-L-isoaspartate(D-aspartate) O-methyltransferase [Bacteroidales bacterium]
MTIVTWIIIPLMFFLFQDPYAAKRDAMVRDQIQARGVHHQATLRAMRTVPRHLFVPENLRRYAYEDHPLSIGYGQTISQPYIVAYMTSVITPASNAKVLEVGTGSGYQAAVLAEIVDSVYTIEIVKALAIQAEQRLRQMQYTNVVVRHGDGYAGWEEHAPFDGIVVTAGAEEIPPPLFEQLKEGGKMVIPIGPAHAVQSLILVTKKNGKLVKTNLMPVRFVPFTRDGQMENEE